MEKLQIRKKLKKEQKGITLVALVITVIVLLILAGVAIGQLSGNGLFEKSKKAKIEQMRAEAKENIDLAIMEIQISESEKGNTVTLKTLHEQLPTVDKRITTEEYADGDNTLNIVYNDKGMALEVTIDSSFNVLVSNTPKDGKSDFEITVDEVKTTSLRVTGNVDTLKDFDATNFTYVAQTSNSNPIKIEHITDTSYIVTGLSQGTEYKVYMLAYDNAGNERKSNVKTVTTESIPDGTKQGAITFGDTTWTSGKASIQISTNESKYYIEYQVNETTDGNWTKATTAGASITVQNLNHNDIVYARLTDGTVSGNYANVTIADVTPPEAFTVKASNSSETSIKIKGTAIDNETGIKDYSYYVKTSDGTVVKTKEHTTDTSWDVTGLTTGTEYTVYMIAYDNAGNPTTSEEKKITVQKPPAYAASGVVEYDAGKWTQPEIDALGILYYENSGHGANAELNFTFGGFKAGDSRNSSVSCQGINKNGKTPTYEGWIVLESEVKNGKTYIKSIVHAGAPENFVYYYTQANDAYRAEYILSSGQRQTGYSTSKGYRNWDKYKDQSKLDLIDSVRCMTKTDADKLPNNNARKTGANYWLGSIYNDYALRYVSYDGIVSFNNVYCWGVRPVVSLKSEVYAISGDGTPEDPFILGMD